MSYETRMVRLGLGHLTDADEQEVLEALERLPLKNSKLSGFEAIQWPCDLEMTKNEVRERLKLRHKE